MVLKKFFLFISAFIISALVLIGFFSFSEKKEVLNKVTVSQLHSIFSKNNVSDYDSNLYSKIFFDFDRSIIPIPSDILSDNDNPLGLMFELMGLNESNSAIVSERFYDIYQEERRELKDTLANNVYISIGGVELCIINIDDRVFSTRGLHFIAIAHEYSHCLMDRDGAHDGIVDLIPDNKNVILTKNNLINKYNAVMTEVFCDAFAIHYMSKSANLNARMLSQSVIQDRDMMYEMIKNPVYNTGPFLERILFDMNISSSDFYDNLASELSSDSMISLFKSITKRPSDNGKMF